MLVCSTFSYQPTAFLKLQGGGGGVLGGDKGRVNLFGRFKIVVREEQNILTSLCHWLLILAISSG